MENGILHVDMNNFYASVETLFAPQYKDVPMAVAGDKESRHGIILAKNMLAKSMGVQTAEPIWQAKRKCPNLQLVPPHRERYLQYSRMAQEIYYRFTDQVEAFSLDECWLDVYGSERLFGDGEQIAQQIRRAVKEELGLTGAEAAALGAAEDFDEVGARLVEDNAGRRMWEFAVEVDVGDTHISGGAFVDAYTGEIVLFDYASGGNG